MGLSIENAPHFEDSQIDSPFYLSLYVIDSLKRGSLFDPNTFAISSLENWVWHFTEKITETVPMPKHMQKEIVQKRMWKTFSVDIKNQKFIGKLDAIDIDNEKSIKDFLRENREKSKETVAEIEEFFKQEEFPPFLWMEYDRFHKVYSEISAFFEDLILKFIALRPKQISQVKERNKQLRIASRVYSDLIETYFQALFSYLRLFVFMEVWSCNKEKDLFTSECKWSFVKVDAELFNPVFFDFHISINRLRQTFFRFKPQEARINLSTPTDWAFKQLILMT